MTLLSSMRKNLAMWELWEISFTWVNLGKYERTNSSSLTQPPLTDAVQKWIPWHSRQVHKERAGSEAGKILRLLSSVDLVWPARHDLEEDPLRCFFGWWLSDDWVALEFLLNFYSLIHSFSIYLLKANLVYKNKLHVLTYNCSFCEKNTKLCIVV